MQYEEDKKHYFLARIIAYVVKTVLCFLGIAMILLMLKLL
jgi:hypothetical protein